MLVSSANNNIVIDDLGSNTGVSKLGRTTNLEQASLTGQSRTWPLTGQGFVVDSVPFSGRLANCQDSGLRLRGTSA